MPINRDLWKYLNNVIDENSILSDVLRAASFRSLFPAVNMRHSSINVMNTSTTIYVDGIVYALSLMGFFNSNGRSLLITLVC